MIIYRRTNTVNGKVYIGKTKQALRARWWSALWDAEHGSNTKLSRAIRKYGSSSFVVDILYHASTEEELNRMETFFIILHQSHLDENGYNMTLGGDGGATITGRKRPGHGEKIRIALTGRKYPGKHGKLWKVGEQSAEHRMKNRLANVRAPRLRICYSCFKSFNSVDNLERVFCSYPCFLKDHTRNSPKSSRQLQKV